MKKLLLMLAFSMFAVSCSDDSSSTSTNTTPVASTIKDKAGNEYKVVKIGSQTWMVENFKLPATYPIKTWDNKYDSSATAWAYEQNNANVANYGLLYCYSPAELDKIAPDGYRLPTKGDWDILFSKVGGILKAAKLKSKSLWNSPNSSANDEYGFNAVPGGYTNANSREFLHLGNFGQYWCGPTISDSTVRYVVFQFQANEAKYGIADRHQQMSVRFIKK